MKNTVNFIKPRTTHSKIFKTCIKQKQKKPGQKTYTHTSFTQRNLWFNGERVPNRILNWKGNYRNTFKKIVGQTLLSPWKMKNGCRNEPNWQTFFITWSNLTIPRANCFTANDKIFVFKVGKHIFRKIIYLQSHVTKGNLEIFPLLLGFRVRKNRSKAQILVKNIWRTTVQHWTGFFLPLNSNVWHTDRPFHCHFCSAWELDFERRGSILRVAVWSDTQYYYKSASRQVLYICERRSFMSEESIEHSDAFFSFQFYWVIIDMQHCIHLRCTE